MTTENGPGFWLKPSEALSRLSLPADSGDESVDGADWQERRYGFTVGNVGLLIGRGTSSELPERADIYPLPGVPPWLCGLVNLRGNLVPVFDVARLLENREAPAKEQRVLILDRGETAGGLLIEGFPRAVGRLRALAQRPPLPEVLRGYAADAFGDGDRVWLEFDHRGFFHSLAARFAD